MLRAGIIGMSFGAQVHLPAMRGIDGVEVRALADGGSGRAASLARELDPPAAAFRDGLDLIDSGDIDLLIVATRPATQARLVLAAVAAGKAVLCEKPFGASLAEAERMTEAAQSAGAKTAIGFQFRYDANLRRLIELVRGGAVGAVHRIDVSWLTTGGRAPERQWSWRHDADQSGGVLTEFCTHVFDYLALLAGSYAEPASVITETVVRDRPHAGGRLPVSAPDKVEMLVRLGRAIAHVSVSNAESVALGHRIEVHGARGRVTFHHRPPFRAADVSLRLETADGVGERAERHFEDKAGEDSRVAATRSLLKDFVAAIRGEAAPLLPDFAAGLAARRAVAAAEALARAW